MARRYRIEGLLPHRLVRARLPLWQGMEWKIILSDVYKGRAIPAKPSSIRISFFLFRCEVVVRALPTLICGRRSIMCGRAEVRPLACRLIVKMRRLVAPWPNTMKVRSLCKLQLDVWGETKV